MTEVDFAIQDVQQMIERFERGGPYELILDDYLQLMAELYEKHQSKWRPPETLKIAWEHTQEFA